MLEDRDRSAGATACRGSGLPGRAWVPPQPGRIEFIVRGLARPVCAPEDVMLRSNPFWRGYRVEVVRLPPSGELDCVSTPCHRIVFAAAGTCDVHYRACGHHARRRLSPGAFCFVRRGYEFDRLGWKARAFEAIIVDIVDLDSDPNPVDAFGRTDALFDMYVGLEDVRVSTLVELMRSEIAAGCPTGATYARSLSLALASRVASICTTIPGARRQPATLAAWQLQRVTDYIATHIAHELTIDHLAALASLSPFHFARCFKQATGMTPHRYVIRERIARAREMLSLDRKSVGEVAMALGFASQSHFADVYRRITGRAPRHDRATP